MVSSITQSKVPEWKFDKIAVRAGSGGSQSCGSFSGLGCTRLIFSGRVAISVTFTVGEPKPFVSVLLGKLTTLLTHVTGY
jgi:hypothetical protein